MNKITLFFQGKKNINILQYIIKLHALAHCKVIMNVMHNQSVNIIALDMRNLFMNMLTQ